MTTREFIKALQDKGIDVLFNQGTTGFVSGISYGYQGFMIKGAKLGNDFKWAWIKNVISYEQERDRAIIQEANIRVKVASPTHDQSFHKESTQLAGNFKNQKSENARVFESVLDAILNKNANHIDEQPEVSVGNAIRKKRRKRRRGRRL